MNLRMDMELCTYTNVSIYKHASAYTHMKRSTRQSHILSVACNVSCAHTCCAHTHTQTHTGSVFIKFVKALPRAVGQLARSH